MVDIPVRCRSGHMRGVASAVSPSAGFRFVCYCKDCQAFARFLKRPDILDAGGGTEILQLPPRQVTFIAGLDALRCVRLSDKVLRRFPVVALIHSIIDCATDESSRDALLGPPLCRIYEHSAIGPLPSKAPAPSLRVFAYRATRLWAGGCADSPGQTRSSMIARRLRVPCRNCSYRGPIGDEHRVPIQPIGS